MVFECRGRQDRRDVRGVVITAHTASSQIGAQVTQEITLVAELIARLHGPRQLCVVKSHGRRDHHRTSSSQDL